MYMKYLVVCSGEAGEEKTLCSDEKDAIALVENKLRAGSAEADLEVYAAEAVNFNVDRVPVVTLSEQTAEPASAEASSERPAAVDYPSSAFSAYTDDEKSETLNPFTTEQVFSLDS